MDSAVALALHPSPASAGRRSACRNRPRQDTHRPAETALEETTVNTHTKHHRLLYDTVQRLAHLGIL